ncbi:MAG TPA: Pls/PosA family non-ribosomal peptide synthetase, partial [Lacunisphaera sp.]|nr:Pls/PosA family non-ribosomal peptide synthetase [Lacunisphaera sp.]
GAVAALPALLLLTVAAKWLLLGPIRAGRHPLWGAYHLRWWFVQGLVSSLHLNHLCGTPLLPFVYRLFGARIGRDVQLETDDLAAFDQISIGDGSSIDDKASLFGSTVEDGELVIGPVQVGRHCFVGARSVVRENTVMGEGARLEDLSLLPAGGEIPAHETWAGSPARHLAASVRVPAPPAPGPLCRVTTLGLYVILALVLPLLPLVAFIPGVVLLSRIDALAQPWLYLAAAPLVGGFFILLLTTGTTLLKWLLLGRARPGTYPVHGGYYLRKWIVDRLLAQSLDVAGSLHATLYLPPWYRALGAKLGRSVELSTATAMTPDLLEIDDGGTVADEVSLSAARVEGGWLTLAPTRLGRRAFVGNGAVVPSGTVLGDGSLVGVLSVPPQAPGDAAAPDSSWLGSPALRLPRRQPSAVFPEQRTFCPSRQLWLMRGAIEILRVTVPPAGFILVTTTVITAVVELWNRAGLGAALLLLPLIYAACCAAVALGMVAAKWVVMGRYRPFQHPLWSTFVWRLEFVNALYEFLATPLALEALQGTPLLPWYLRLLGARIGRRTYIHTTGFLEWDLIEVGDEAVLNEDCVLQTHLFEDRVLKAARLRVGPGCELGAGSVVLYDSEMADGSRLDALSLLMKGERLPPGTAWAGSPASSAGAGDQGSVRNRPAGGADLERRAG